MNIHEIRKLCPFEEVGYLQLMQILKHYAAPRNKLQALLKKKDLIRIKKGLYIFGSNAARGPYSREHLANLIYGPSALSLEYALSHYNMIPEKVEEVTSITIRRNKLFMTPIGRFNYQYLAPQKYWIGISQIDYMGRNILIATKEKAVCDILYLKTERLKNIKALEEHLFENLRIEEYHLQTLDFLLIKQLSECYQNHNIHLLLAYVKEIK